MTMTLPAKILSFCIKGACIVIGGVVTLVALMSLIGLVSDNFWARLLGAIVVAIMLPTIIADRALPDGAEENHGIVSDVFATAWMGTAVLFVVLGISFTGDLLRAEASRLATDGWEESARLAGWLAGSSALSEVANASTTPMPSDATPPPTVEQETVDAGSPTPVPSDAAPVETPRAKKEERETMPPADLFKKWAPSVVTIQTGGRFGAGSGTGFIVDAKGIVVTNHHVIRGSEAVSVKLMDGRWADEVELLAEDEKLDIAILKITSRIKLNAVELGDSDAVTVGERAISIGNPLGLEHTLTDGLVSARRLKDGRKMIQVSTPVSPGNSGGPLFNAYGEVIGVTSESMSTRGYGENLGMAVAINHVKPLLKKKYKKKKKRIGGGSPEGSGTW